ncbi:NUDIX domain-containing protein, partial [Streptomyces sp. SID7760]|nr:NUDIX domain-containing protein [Streptomyces sp. SID7760]
MPDRSADRPSDRPAEHPSDDASDHLSGRPSPDEARLYYAARPSPLVAATAIVVDSAGRVLVLAPPYRADAELPGATVEDTQTPEEALARGLEELGLSAPIGRLLAVESRRPGSLGRSLLAHVHLVGPLPAKQAGALSCAGGAPAGARWLTPEEAYAVLPARLAPRLR